MKFSEAFPPRNGLHTREKKHSFGVCNANSLRGSVINSRFGWMILPITAAIYSRPFWPASTPMPLALYCSGGRRLAYSPDGLAFGHEASGESASLAFLLSIFSW